VDVSTGRKCSQQYGMAQARAAAMVSPSLSTPYQRRGRSYRGLEMTCRLFSRGILQPRVATVSLPIDADMAAFQV
jgi:hypothetical protein